MFVLYLQKCVFEHFEDRLHGFSLIVFLPKLVSIKKMYFQYLVIMAVAVRAWLFIKPEQINSERVLWKLCIHFLLKAKLLFSSFLHITESRKK